MIQELRDAIAQELGAINKKALPKIHETIQNDFGYSRVEELMIDTMIDNRFTAAESLMHVEMKL